MGIPTASPRIGQFQTGVNLLVILVILVILVMVLLVYLLEVHRSQTLSGRHHAKRSVRIVELRA